ncbi:peptidoglycan recognition protein family protein [Streptomyces roseicoloratus]|uniref:peptidoglycan recognition protein family protein n=1 Tax=Streptomyces roseicoloratus TaxID=2508722 RepID=UPI001009E824|nr:N-acetylmuramoyl-L-alanine amidase [Streptomyces roseicoloratus]
MAWYPGATKYELQPESDQQPEIRPTQFIAHSIIAPWTAKRVYEYWRDSTNLESHFGLGYEGDLGQFIGTETRADANYRANLRPDGTGAVSIETASNLEGSDPWTPAQVERLIELGVWLHRTHGIPLRICRTASDPGFGYHRLHADWAKDGTDCPGDARVRQFTEVVFPGIVARATNPPPASGGEVPNYVNLGLKTPMPLPPGGGFTSVVFENEWSDTAGDHVPNGSVAVRGPASFTGSLSLTVSDLPPGEVVQVRMSEYDGGTWKADHPTHDVAGTGGVTTAVVPLVKRLGPGRGMRVRLSNQAGQPVTVVGAVLTALVFKES